MPVDSADAVPIAAGAVADAPGEATNSGAVLALRDAVRSIETARARLRDRDPDAAAGGWKGLVAARWTLLDQFESDGNRYVVARRNDVELSGVARLTQRERQALGYARLGHTNKLIAYEMGITASTVSVLLCRAARKLGTSTREELIAKFAAASDAEAVGKGAR